MNLYKIYGQTFIPFRLREENGLKSRCWVGGEPPVGIAPNFANSFTRHLATLGLEERIDVSLFSTFDYSAQETPFGFFEASCMLHDESSALVQFVVHRPVVAREVGSPLKSELSALGFAFDAAKGDPESPTLQSFGNQQIYAGHKVGGVPYFSQVVGEMEAVVKALADGYVHLLQISFPSNEDSMIRVDWPFGESVFHVFAKKDGDSITFRYIWA